MSAGFPAFHKLRIFSFLWKFPHLLSSFPATSIIPSHFMTLTAISSLNCPNVCAYILLFFLFSGWNEEEEEIVCFFFYIYINKWSFCDALGGNGSSPPVTEFELKVCYCRSGWKCDFQFEFFGVEIIRLLCFSEATRTRAPNMMKAHVVFIFSFFEGEEM